MYESLVNEEEKQYDIDDYYNVPERVRIQFELCIAIGDADIQGYDSDSKNSRLKYRIIIPTPILPIVKLNSFFFTDKKGNIIPSIIYYRTNNNEAHIIDNLPVIFTNDIKQHMRNEMFQIFVECSQSYNETDFIYINYDVKVGTEHFRKQSKYSKKTFFDWRPKIW